MVNVLRNILPPRLGFENIMACGVIPWELCDGGCNPLGKCSGSSVPKGYEHTVSEEAYQPEGAR